MSRNELPQFNYDSEVQRRSFNKRTRVGLSGLALLFAATGLAAIKCSPDTKPENSPRPTASHTLVPTASAETQTPEASITVPTTEPTQSSVSEESASPTPIETQQASGNPEVKNGFISLGSEIDLSLQNENLIYTPDGHTPYVSFSDGSRKYFITSSVSTYLIETNGESLKNAIQNNHVDGKITKVFSPEQNQGFNYSGITSVFQLDGNDEKHLTAILHEEERRDPSDVAGVKASVGSVESFDGGITWQNKKVLIWGANPGIPGGPSYSGAGEPNGIQIGDYLYIYYIDWTQGQQPDQIYLARTGVENGTISGNMEFYSNGVFGSGLEKDHTAVIPAQGYSGLPSVSFNIDLNQYLCVFEGSTGFYQTTSIDGVNWSEPQIFAKFGNSGYKYTYPSLESDDLLNDHTTSASGTLYYAKSLPGTAHNLVARPFEIK